MKRQLPTVDIDGNRFFIDVQKEELRQTDNPANTITFNVFRQKEDGYTFLYDTTTRNAVTSKKAATDHIERMRWVTLPALMELDPEGIALKYDIPLEVLCSGAVPPPQQGIKAIIRPAKHE